jgi:hypothetical protein
MPVSATRLDRVEHEDIRHEVDGGGRIAQLIEQFRMRGCGAGWRDVDQVHVVRLGVSASASLPSVKHAIDLGTRSWYGRQYSSDGYRAAARRESAAPFAQIVTPA